MTMAVKEVTVGTMEEYLNACVWERKMISGETPWWRGQSDASWGLLPSVHRFPTKQKREANMALDFIKLASVRHTNVPKADDLSGWLFLMQHYGLPTRLLDWTQSPLVALYFAITNTKDKDKDAAVWGLHPEILNSQYYGVKCLADCNDEKVEVLVNNAFNGVHTVEKTIALQCKHEDLRQMIQFSEVTIHGCNTSLETHKIAGDFLIKIIIPSKSKEQLKFTLKMLRITSGYLFPDLDHLAQAIRNSNY